MRDGGFLDLKNRPGKAGGGFCTSFPTAGVPFIFANFNGTHGDVGVFTHEMGHAFQNWESRFQPGIDYLWPTMEAAEINSMGLEFLTLDGIGHLVGEAEAERFRRMHLITSLAFLPYGVCVDHFQHEVYANPTATPAERHAMWQALERRYMPWTGYGDLAYPAKGGALAGQGAHLPLAVLLHRLHAGAVLRDAVLGAAPATITLPRWTPMCACAAAAAPPRSGSWCARPAWSPPSRRAPWRRWCGRRRPYCSREPHPAVLRRQRRRWPGPPPGSISWPGTTPGWRRCTTTSSGCSRSCRGQRVQSRPWPPC